MKGTMANGRIYGGSNVSHLLQNDGFSESFDSLLFPTSSSTFQGSRSMVNFADINMSDKNSFFRPFDPEENGDEDFDEYLRQPDKKRRLSVDQVQFLERSFELENKLEPDRKIQLARELGLQPRQVAIWFQNRRARWKTKQLEKDYDALKSSYNSLKFNYENLLKEKEKLKTEVLALTNQQLVKEKEVANAQLPDQNSVPALDESIVVCKQEDISSANSDVVDSNSPRLNNYVVVQSSLLVEPADSSHVFELDHSDLSQDEEDNNSSESLVPSSVYAFEKLEEPIYPYPPPASSCNNGFLAEEHATWFWSY